MKKLLSALVVTLAFGSAVAQSKKDEPIAKIIELDGLVTVADQNQLVNGSLNLPLFKGARVLTTSTGVATVEFDNGCRVKLKPNESLTVDENECKALLLASGAAAPLTGGQIAMRVGAVGLLAIIVHNNDKKVSGS